MEFELSAIVARHGRDRTHLVQILRDVAATAGCVSPPVITRLAQLLGLPRGQVEGVAGFYSFLGSEPRGRYRVLFSDDVTDEMEGSGALLQRMLDAFRVEPGQVSRGGQVSIDRTSCTGLCDQGPSLLVNGHAIARLTPERIGAISALIRGGSPVSAWPDNLFAIRSQIRRRGLLLGTPFEAGDGVRAALARGAEGMREEVRRSGLRGRGGAGFGTADKWEACARAPGPPRYVICNADEGEPGTFKDRELLGQHLDLVLDGMTVAAVAVRAGAGFLYLRAEYPWLVEPIEAALAARRQAGLLGRDVCGERGFDFDLELRIGAGAYVCGEESALLESMEGKRGIPRIRPPYPVTRGYLGAPTVVNNVETLAACALVAVHGGAWLRASGTNRSAGTKLLSVSGDVARPGVYEYPFGVTVAQVLADAGAEEPQAVQVGGPSGTLLAGHEFGRTVAFEDVPTAGAFLVFDQSRDVLAVAANFARFFAHESCGFCTPCRVGTTLNSHMMARVVAGKGARRDIKDLARVSRVMKVASHCGLGGSAGNPVLDVLEKFRPAFEARVKPAEAQPVFDLDEALAPAREATARDDAAAHFPGEAW